MSFDKIAKTIVMGKDLKSLKVNEQSLGLVKKFAPIPRLSTGSFMLDHALGGGYPVGRVIELFGEPGAGKTTLCYLAVSTLLNTNPTARILFVDFESALAPEYSLKWQLDPEEDNIDILRPVNLELGLEYIKKSVIADEYDLVIIDSIVSNSTIAEQNKNIGEHTMATRARIITDWLNTMTNPLLLSKTTMLVVNQTRANLNAISKSPYSLPGGKALKFAKSLSLYIRENRKTFANTIAVPIKIRIAKTKVWKPYLDDIEVDIIIEKDGEDIYQVDILGEAYKIAKQIDFITNEDGTPLGKNRKSYYKDTFLGSSEEEVKRYFAEHVDFFQDTFLPALQERMANLNVPAPDSDEYDVSDETMEEL